MRVLLQFRADASCVGPDGHTAMSIAARTRSMPIVALLERRELFERVNTKDGSTGSSYSKKGKPPELRKPTCNGGAVDSDGKPVLEGSVSKQAVKFYNKAQMQRKRNDASGAIRSYLEALKHDPSMATVRARVLECLVLEC